MESDMVYPPALKKFTPFYNFFNHSGKGFCGVVGAHHLQHVLFEVNLINHHLNREQVLDHGECEKLSEPCELINQWG